MMTRSTSGLGPRLLVLLLLGLGISLGLAAPAGAHAVLESSSPASGAQLDAAPATVRLDFDEAVGLDLGYVRLFRAGRRLEIGEARHPSGRPDLVVARLPRLSPGVYTVGYRVISADGHPVTGDVAFRVGAGAAPRAAVTADARPSRTVGLAYGLVRLVAYLALVLAVGAPIAVAAVEAQWWPAVRPLARIAAVVLAVAALVQVALAAPYLAGTSGADALRADRWADVVATSAGRWWLVRAAGALVLAALLARLDRLERVDRPLGRGARAALAAVVALDVVVVVSFVADGHAVAGRWIPLAEASTFVHLTAMAIWCAGLLLLGAASSARWGDRWPTGSWAVVARRWSPVAAACVVALALTGVLQAWRVIDRWDLASPYQRLLLAKTVGTVVMLASALAARRWLHRAEGARPEAAFGRSVRVEALAGVAVLAITTVLVQTSPVAPAGGVPGPSPSPAATSTTGPPPDQMWMRSVDQGGRRIDLHLDGATVGRHSLQLTLDDTAAPLRAPITARARLVLPARSLGPFPVLLRPAGDRRWVASSVEITEPGTWRLEVIVDDPSSTIRFSTDLRVES